jgi:MscS family membrane protein
LKSFYYFALLVCCVLAAETQGQSLPRQVENANDAKSAKTEASDALGRNTPNGTVFGFLEAARNGSYKEAAQYLQISGDTGRANGPELARQLYFLMESAFVERIGIISGHLEGSHQIGVPRDRERIGVFRINGADTNVDLVHVSDPTSGEIWLFSSEVVSQVPGLFSQIESGEAEVGRSHLQVIRRFLNTSNRRWLAFVLLVPIALILGWLAARAVRATVRLLPRWRHANVTKEAFKSLTAPLTLVLGVILHQIGVYLLGIPVVTRLHYQTIVSSLLVIGTAWFVFRFINIWSDQARARTLDSSDYRRGSIILLGQRISKVLVVIVAGLLTLSILGFDITTAVAGLGIGSIALAFAAQKTLENLLGGVSILGDEVIRIGEICRVGERVGTVEDISLRSTRFRTVEGTVLSVPNGELANMNLENISRRDKSLFRTRIGLRQETEPERLRSLLLKISSLLRQHPKVESDGAFWVRLVGFGEDSLEIEISCHVWASRLDQFMAIREEMLLRIMELIADAGTGFAVPSRLLYMPESTNPESTNKEAVQQSENRAPPLRYGSF